MTLSESELWDRIEAFSIDKPGSHSALDFRARLARENGWTLTFAERAILEYKRFLFLAMTSDQMVTPSEEVDEVWHLHLVYTESYWSRLCGEVLQRPLHHHPTQGGMAEGSKFRECYERTLARYEEAFGEKPPKDYWPHVDERFSPRQITKVDLNQKWLLPRLRLPRFAGHVSPSAFAVGLLALGGSALLTGCASQVLDLHGSAFLGLFVVLIPGAFLLSFLLGRIFVADGPSIRQEPIDNPYHVAFLGGGQTRMFQAILARLYEAKLISFIVTGKNGSKVKRLNDKDSDTAQLTPEEERVLHALPRESYETLHSVRQSLSPVFEGVREELSLKGLIMTSSQRSLTRLVAMLPVLGLMAFGVAKVVVGLGRDKPVLFLVLLLLVCVGFLIVRNSKIRHRTKAGEQLWQQLRAGRKEIRSQLAQPDQAGNATTIPMAVAVLGTAAVAPTAHADFLTYQKAMENAGRTGANHSGGCGTGCGGSGCGGGGCGGGCGGCGG